MTRTTPNRPPNPPYRGPVDHSTKSILARGCDPIASAAAATAIPPLIGNPEYVPTTDDEDFVEKLQSREWSIVLFAPGACRFSAARQPIPGGNSQTQGWTLQQYHELVRKHQGDKTQIVETPDETQTVGLLKQALTAARDTN
jgi:hypothetical protein